MEIVLKCFCVCECIYSLTWKFREENKSFLWESWKQSFPKHHTGPELWDAYISEKQMRSREPGCLGRDSTQNVWLKLKNVGTLETCLRKENLLNLAEMWCACIGIYGNKSYKFLSHAEKKGCSDIFNRIWEDFKDIWTEYFKITVELYDINNSDIEMNCRGPARAIFGKEIWESEIVGNRNAK